MVMGDDANSSPAALLISDWNEAARLARRSEPPRCVAGGDSSPTAGASLRPGGGRQA